MTRLLSIIATSPTPLDRNSVAFTYFENLPAVVARNGRPVFEFELYPAD